MSPDFVIGFGRQAIELCLMMALPMLSVGLGVGVLVSVIQAATQIQEMTLTFIPKILAIALVMLLLGPWMLNVITGFTTNLFNDLAVFGKY